MNIEYIKLNTEHLCRWPDNSERNVIVTRIDKDELMVTVIWNEIDKTDATMLGIEDVVPYYYIISTM